MTQVVARRHRFGKLYSLQGIGTVSTRYNAVFGGFGGHSTYARQVILKVLQYLPPQEQVICFDTSY